MGSYILFLFGDFEDHDDIEFFCMEHFSDISEKGVKYVIEKGGNCIIIFDTDRPIDDLETKLAVTLSIDQVKFYFLFERSSVITAYIPEQIKDYIFKPLDDENVKIIIPTESHTSMDLDEILDKIEQQGVNSLTEDEKKFLDQFGK